jgi:hypothetical protein
MGWIGFKTATIRPETLCAGHNVGASSVANMDIPKNALEHSWTRPSNNWLPLCNFWDPLGGRIREAMETWVLPEKSGLTAE